MIEMNVKAIDNAFHVSYYKWVICKSGNFILYIFIRDVNEFTQEITALENFFNEFVSKRHCKPILKLNVRFHSNVAFVERLEYMHFEDTYKL